MTSKSRFNRRNFMKSLAMGSAMLAAPAIIPATALGRGTRPAPSGRINLGVIGCGGMGLINMHNFMGLDDVEILAVCDCDTRRVDTAVQVVSEHEEARHGRTTPVVKGYHEFEELLERPDIDAVLIATPDHWHAGMGIAAAKAGKHIYGEKPLARTIREGRNMVRVVERHNTVFQVGTQSRSYPPIQNIINLLHYGVIGNIQRVELNLPQYGGFHHLPASEPPEELDYERWLGPAPWRPCIEYAVHGNFRTVLDFSGGTITDHGTHRLDIAQWGCGMDLEVPVEVEGEAQYPTDGPFDAPTIARFEMKFKNGMKYYCETEPDMLKWGVKFIGDEGWIQVPMNAPLPHLPISASNSRLLSVRVPPSQRVAYPSDNHWANFIECCKTGSRPAQSIQVGNVSTNLCHLANIAMELDRPIRFDAETESFPGDPEANAKLDRPKRMPWARFFQV